MGSEIAQLAAVNGVDVCLSDTQVEPLNRAHKSISTNIQRLVSKALLSEERGGDAIRRLKCSQNLEDFQCVDIVIEAIVESESVKKKLYVICEELCNIGF
nr:uncharacterized protein LOC109187794 [Ipomoea trifida]